MCDEVACKVSSMTPVRPSPDEDRQVAISFSLHRLVSIEASFNSHIA